MINEKMISMEIYLSAKIKDTPYGEWPISQ